MHADAADTRPLCAKVIKDNPGDWETCNRPAGHEQPCAHLVPLCAKVVRNPGDGAHCLLPAGHEPPCESVPRRPEPEPSRKPGERARLAEQIARLRGLVDGLEASLNYDVPLSENAQVVADAALRIVATAARHDAYDFAERYAKRAR